MLRPPSLQPWVPHPKTKPSRLCFLLPLLCTGVEKSLAQTPTGFLCRELSSAAHGPLPPTTSTSSLKLPERPWPLARPSSQAPSQPQVPPSWVPVSSRKFCASLWNSCFLTFLI